MLFTRVYLKGRHTKYAASIRKATTLSHFLVRTPILSLSESRCQATGVLHPPEREKKRDK